MPTGSPGRRGETGYTLAFLVGILTVLAIGLGAAMPHWVARAQREKEAELVARGVQYAEAIRVFQRRFGRLPNTLAELVELEPRSIRRLWRNPFAQGDAVGWAILVEVGGQVVPVDPASGAVVAAPPGSEAAGGAPAGATGVAVAGPIHGVRSLARGEAYRRFFEWKDYGDWEFSVERLVAASGATTPEGLLRRLDDASLGRGFPYAPPGGAPGAGAATPQGSAPGGSPPSQPPSDAPTQEDEEDEANEEAAI